ncbi:hypothetical protein [Stenotrophomonas sp.]|uniref:hypothetical protein n=1 Tax=Stenotrophomonas sp. TaxID=69392 RepID=UPI00289EFDC0|nr:hypothetical protein [Stenotrophomonas sp.]
MSTSLWIAIALAAITLVASARLLRTPRNPVAPGSARLPLARNRLRVPLLLLLQVLAAALLYFTLQPPTRTGDAGNLVILTANATTAGPVPASATVIALPEADAPAGIPRAPDLATALRQHPGGSTLTLVGDGLVARDRDTALPARVTLQPAPAPRGWVDLQPPAITAPGGLFTVTARAQGVANARAELLDPAGVVVDRAPLDAQGNVRLQGSARDAGRSEFILRVLDTQQHTVDSVPVPLQTVVQPAPRVLMLAAAPGPEWKYLRRWATDTGLALQAQANAGGGVMLGDAPVPLTAARLAATDVLVLDERSLTALGTSQRSLIQQALREGLGVLVRSSGPLSDSARQTLRGWGLAVSGGTRATPLTLPADPESALLQARRGPARPAADSTAYIDDANAASHSSVPPTLERFDLNLADADPLLRDAKSQPVGGWRSVGRGRLAVLPISDSYRLVLAGRDDRYAELWSSVVAQVARALPAVVVARVESATPWSGERMSICQVTVGAQMADPHGRKVTLQIDPASGTQRCAGYWPAVAGWHQLQQGEATQAFYVFERAGAVSLHREQLRQTTAQRLTRSSTASSGSPVPVPGPRWPWLLAFVAVAGLLWWLERRRPAMAG